MSTTESPTSDSNDDAWDRLEAERDLFETIVEQDGPFAPEAEDILTALDERQESDDV